MKTNRFFRVICYFAMIVISLIWLSPLYILLSVSLKPLSDLSSRWIFPINPYIENYSIALQKGNLLRALLNTVIVTFGATILVIVTGALASYPLSRNRSRLNKNIHRFIMGLMMIPPLSILVPLYKTMMEIGAVSTLIGEILVVATFQLPLTIYLFTNFISAIPIALDEAASIDGCPPASRFFLIIMPQLKPICATVIIIAGSSFWNDYQFAGYLLQKPNLQTITLAISGFFDMFSSNMNAAAAAALLSILPLVIVYLFLQKYFIQSMVDSAIK